MHGIPLHTIAIYVHSLLVLLQIYFSEKYTITHYPVYHFICHPKSLFTHHYNAPIIFVATENPVHDDDFVDGQPLQCKVVQHAEECCIALYRIN